MDDKALSILIRTQLLAVMQATTGLSSVGLARNYQPTQQGAATGAYVYFAKLFDRRYGHVERREVWNQTAGAFDHVERQQYETTYQFTAMVPQNAASATELSESDILNRVSGIMQSDAMLAAFQAAGVGILRVTEVRNPYMLDDRDLYEAMPSFDLVVTHKRQTVTTLPAVVTYDATISRV